MALTIALPLGTHTGRNVYRAQPCELGDHDGSFIQFARAKTEREAAGDPRLAPEERFGSPRRMSPKSRRRQKRVTERLLLPTAPVAYVAAAKACDRFRATAVAPSGRAFLRPLQALLGCVNLMRMRQVWLVQESSAFIIVASGLGLRPARGQATAGDLGREWTPASEVDGYVLQHRYISSV
jgi:hypothetical protein